jgi:hypothetical protein
LDGKFLGYSPLTVNYIKDGKHEIKVSKDGYNNLIKYVTIKPGIEQSVDYSLLKFLHRIERYAISFFYMPRWVGNFGSGEPDYHFLMAGLRYRINRRYNLVGAFGYYTNGNYIVGPDFWPVHIAAQIDIFTNNRIRFFIAPQYTLFSVTKKHDWNSESGKSIINTFGIGAGGGLIIASYFNVVIQGTFYAAESADWTYDRTGIGAGFLSESTTDFSGFQVLGNVEITF